MRSVASGARHVLCLSSAGDNYIDVCCWERTNDSYAQAYILSEAYLKEELKDWHSSYFCSCVQKWPTRSKLKITSKCLHCQLFFITSLQFCFLSLFSFSCRSNVLNLYHLVNPCTRIGFCMLYLFYLHCCGPTSVVIIKSVNRIKGCV